MLLDGTLVHAEVAALLAEPPVWLDLDAPHDKVPTPLVIKGQRGRIKAMWHRWRWECSMRGPAGSPYEGASYRVLVRVPIGYPLLAPKLSFLSIITHMEVEARDPYEGQLDESFYDRLGERSERAATVGEAPSRSPLRFAIGQRVRCFTGVGWERGRILELWPCEAAWPSGADFAAYQVELADGRKVYALSDVDAHVCSEPAADSVTERAEGGAGSASSASSEPRHCSEQAGGEKRQQRPGPATDTGGSDADGDATDAHGDATDVTKGTAACEGPGNGKRRKGGVPRELPALQPSPPDAIGEPQPKPRADPLVVVSPVVFGAAASKAAASGDAQGALVYRLRDALSLLFESLSGPLRRPPLDQGNGMAAADGSFSAADLADLLGGAGPADPLVAHDHDQDPLDQDQEDHADPLKAKYLQEWAEMAARHREELETMAEYRLLCLHPPLFSPHVDPLWLAPSMLSLFGVTPERAAARRAGGGLWVPPTAEAIRSFVEEVAPGIYAFDFFSDAFCDKLLAELEQYEDSGLPVSRPNSMNNYGVVLNLIGMERTMDALQALIVRPIAAALFPVEGETVDHHHSFMVQYKQGEDLGLDMHTDACDVTLNVCLGKEFTGAGLTFCGLRGDGSGRERRFLYRQVARPGLVVGRGEGAQLLDTRYPIRSPSLRSRPDVT